MGDAAFAPLKVFVQKHALVYERQSLARTYGAFDLACNDKLLGYITLVCGEVVTGVDDDPLVAGDGLSFRYRQYPAVKIARLAVDRRVRGAGVGSGLVNLAVGIAKESIAPNVGCRFVMVDSKQPSIRFYAGVGFTMLDTAVNRRRDEPVMFIDLSKV